MDTIDYKEGNRLIVEFMGAKIGCNNTVIGYTTIRIPDHAFLAHDFDTLRIGGYMYYLSWDWLMPVIRNFFDIHRAGVHREEIISRMSECNIIETYKSVVKSIK